MVHGAAEQCHFQLLEKMIQKWFSRNNGDLPADESKALFAKLDCARYATKKMAMTVFKTEGPETLAFDQAITSAIRQWMRFLEAAEVAKKAPGSQLVQVGFDSILAADDRGLLDLRGALANVQKSKLTSATEAVKSTMEVGANWKETAKDSDDMSIEQLITMAENSLMLIKGKKLHTGKDALNQVGQHAVVSQNPKITKPDSFMPQMLVVSFGAFPPFVLPWAPKRFVTCSRDSRIVSVSFRLQSAGWMSSCWKTVNG